MSGNVSCETKKEKMNNKKLIVEKYNNDLNIFNKMI